MKKEERNFLTIILFMLFMSVLSIIKIFEENTVEIYLFSSALIMSTMGLIHIYKKAKKYEKSKNFKK